MGINMKCKKSLVSFSIGVISLFLSQQGSFAADYPLKKHSSMSMEQYPGKPHAPITLTHLLKKNLALGELVKLNLSLTNTTDVDNMQVKLRLSEGLSSVDIQPEYNFGIMSKKNKSSILLTLSSNSAGLFYVYITSSIVNAGQVQSRSFTVPVNIGNVKAKNYLKQPAGIISTDSTGARIISMPAKAVNAADGN